ncbi:MAG: hypothetical protein AMXMBFR82_23680 [Candidatus Hydrogenedentota bacterium]
MPTLAALVKRFHDDETGAPEMSTIMIVALVAIPLIIGIIYFGQSIIGWFQDAESEIEGTTIDP